MNAGLLRKTLRDTWLLLVLATLALFIFEIVFSIAIQYSISDMRHYMRRMPPFLKQLLTILAGADISNYLTPSGLMSIGFSHPFLHAVIWAFSIAYVTRVLVGEVDRGTADLLLALPMRRSTVFGTLTALWAGCGLLLVTAPWLGAWFAQSALGKGPFDLPRLAIVCVNMYAVYLAIGCLAMPFSAALSRRGVAVGIIVALLLASFVLNFLSSFWSPAQQVAFLGVLDYYKPLPIIATGQWPWRQMGILVAAAAVGWCVGLGLFARRDIPAA